MQATRRLFSDGRWHLQHGPIDLVISARGEHDAVAHAHEECWLKFQGILPGLVRELAALRQDLNRPSCAPIEGQVARRMLTATACYCPQFITPMAAVAGAVADELIGCFHRIGIRRAAINNGGDIAMHLTPGEHFAIAIGQIEASGHVMGSFRISATDPVRGIATSGWRGRSFSLGIADSVTVIARTAAEADAAATMIANAVNIEHPDIVRQRASAVKDDSDLGDLLVTRSVPILCEPEVDDALAAGERYALNLYERGLIAAAAMVLQGRARQVGAPLTALAASTCEQRERSCQAID